MKLPPLLLLGLFASLGTGCMTKNTSKADFESFQTALSATDKKPGNAEAAQSGIARFKKLFTAMKNPDFKERVLSTYAENAYLNDTLVELRGNKVIANYLTETAKNSESLEMTYEDFAHSGNNYYLRWVMVIRSKVLSHGEPLYSTGMTLLRLDRDGRVTMHKDYWDSASGFYKHLPVLGPEIQFIQSRLQKSSK
ncbi:MAG: nuclear transport factor 2 family protein [Chthoniobacterales bacterium]